MIERLMREEARYGEPEYSRKSAEIDQTTRALYEILDADEKQGVAQLEDAYQPREAAAIRSAFLCCRPAGSGCTGAQTPERRHLSLSQSHIKHSALEIASGAILLPRGEP